MCYPEVEAMNYDVGGENIGMNSSLLDFPSLRDLETYNFLSALNHNFNIKRYMDSRRLEILEKMNGAMERGQDKGMRFSDMTKELSRGEAAEHFMGLMIFA